MGDLVSVDEAADVVGSGQRLGLGGMMLARRPVGLCRALAERDITGLEVIALTSSVEADVLIEAGAVGTLRTSMISMGLFGFAPAWSQAVMEGTITSIAETEMSIVAGLRARLAGLGFEPALGWQGTDYLAERPDVKTITCPYTGDVYVAFPRIDVDVAFVHALAADRHGNAYLGTDLGVDRELVRSATTTVVSAERILTTGELLARGEVDVLARDVELVVELKGGALPTACEPEYALDPAALRQWAERRLLDVA